MKFLFAIITPMMKLQLFYLVLQIQMFKCAKILGIFPTPSFSHQIVFRALCEGLASRGHNVTIMTTHPENSSFESCIQIKLIGNFDESMVYTPKLGPILNRAVQEYPLGKYALTKLFAKQMQNELLQKVLSETSEFDLIIVEGLWRAIFGIKGKTKAPVIAVTSLTGFISNFESVGNTFHPLYYPYLYAMSFEDTLLNRIENIIDFFYITYTDLVMSEFERKHAEDIFRVDDINLSDLEKDIDMLHLNIFTVMGNVRPNVPALINMGGLHLRNENTLAIELQDYLDSAKEGIIYMSLGSNVMSKDLPKERLQMFMDTFKELPYKVLWKFEADNITGLPDNVKISKWLPQQDMLGHPNIKAFITQGGQQSMEEAIRAALPLVCLPFFGDQHLNSQKIVEFHIGVTFDINTLTKDVLKDGLETVIKDKSYKESMKKLSTLMLDQPVSPLEESIWWIEYVIRHKGAKHFRSPAVGVGFIEFFMLDILAYLILSFLLSFAGVSYCVYIVYHKCLSLNFKKEN